MIYLKIVLEIQNLYICKFLLLLYHSMDTRPQQSTNRDRVQLVYLNEQIKAPNIIIVDEEGKNVGTFPRRRALEIAQEK